MWGGGTSNLQGGAIYAQTNVELTISGCAFTSNSAIDVSPFLELFSGPSLTLPQSFFGPSWRFLNGYIRSDHNERGHTTPELASQAFSKNCKFISVKRHAREIFCKISLRVRRIGKHEANKHTHTHTLACTNERALPTRWISLGLESAGSHVAYVTEVGTCGYTATRVPTASTLCSAGPTDT